MVPGWLNCKLNFCGDGGSGSWDVDNVRFPCCRICAGSNQMCAAYYPKLAIEKHYWSNKWRRLKASFHGDDGLLVAVKECGFHLIYTEDIPEDTGTDTDDHRRRWDNTQGTQHNDDQLMMEYNDKQRRCDTDTNTSSSVEAEDATATAQTNYHHTVQFTERNDPSMVTTTQNVNNNVVDAQDDEEDRTHNWLERHCNFVQRICCRRY